MITNQLLYQLSYTGLGWLVSATANENTTKTMRFVQAVIEKIYCLTVKIIVDDCFAKGYDNKCHLWQNQFLDLFQSNF